MTCTPRALKSSKQAESYHDKDDYYHRDRSPSEWWGRGAERLGLSGPVDRATFGRMLEGKLPDGASIHRGGTSQRPGVDVTFSAPKSVSIVALVVGDARLLEAHEKAVSAALEHLQERAACRMTIRGETRRIETGEAIVARFNHSTSRELDPQLHTHALVMNATYNEQGGKWQAIDNHFIFDEQMTAGAIYHNELARACREAGYELRDFGKNGEFELAHISNAEVELFSKRSQQVESALAARGLDRDSASAAIKTAETRATRKGKTHDVDHGKLRDDWRVELASLGKETGRDFNAVPAAREIEAPASAAHEGIASSLRHFMERNSAVSEKALLRHAVANADGRYSVREVRKEIDDMKSAGNLVLGKVGNEAMFTTREAQEREQTMLDQVRRGIDKAPAILSAIDARDRLKARDELDRRESFEKAIGTGKSEAEAVAQASKLGLNTGQREAAELILSSRDRVVAVQGVAGAGKTFMLDRVTREAKAAGFEVVGLAPSHQAKGELQAVTGAGDTLQKFLSNPKSWSEYGPKHLVVVDEAGLASTRQLAQLVEIADRQKFKLALIGDTRQFKAVEAGQPFAQVQTVAKTARMNESLRHKNADLKQAAKLAAEGKMTASLAKLAPQVQQIKAPEARVAAIADRYVAMTPAERKETLVLTGTNDSRQALNDAIRERLGLAGKGIKAETLIPTDNTAEERKRLGAYKAGQMVEFAKGYKSLDVVQGERLTVAEVAADRVILARGDERIDFHPARIDTEKVTIYDRAVREFSPGDQVRFRENDKGLNIKNGDRGIVSSIDGKLSIEVNGRQVALDADKPLRLDHGYAMTGHSAQGATVDRVIADIDTKSKTATSESFYTNMTRARHDVEIYVDDAKRLPDAVSRAVEKHNALEIGAQEVPQPAMQVGGAALEI